MKRRLDEFTVSEFAELMSGNLDVLGKPEGSKEEIARVVRDIVIEYREIADPGGLRGYLVEGEDYSKARSTLALFTICNILVTLKKFDNVREILTEYGMDASKMTDSRIAAEVKGKLAKAQSVIDKIEEEKLDISEEMGEIRRNFDMQTAALMAHFKFQIDPSTMRATIYANLIARYNMEIKAIQERLKK